MKNMKKIMMLLLSFVFIVLVSSCSNNTNTSLKRKYDDITITNDKYRNYYEIFVRSFYDTDGDGIGDLKGVIEKLDYVKDLGFNGIWLMPVNKGTSYHKYDVEDYYDIDKDFGTLADMEELITKAHEKDINIIMDLVVNHTSNRHPWFVTACNNLKAGKTTAQYSDYYNFTNSSGSGYSSVPGASNYYYECQFWSGMPDLNLDSQNVRNEIKNIMKFWLDKGVDGFRLDACTSFYTNMTTYNVSFLKWLYESAKEVKEDVYMVGEAWVTADTNVRKYYDSGVDSFFCFPVSQGSGAVANCLRSNKANPGELFTKLIETQEEIYDIGILAPFLSNHDTKRAASFLGRDNFEKIKFAQGLISLMKGCTFVYYGEEIGMSSPEDNDPCKRVAFLWDTRESEGYVTKQPESKYVTDAYYYFGSSKKQLEDPDSITNYYKYANYIRNANPEIARGVTTTYDYVEASNQVSVFQRTYNNSTVTIVVNLSYDTPVTLKLDKEALKFEKMTQYLCATYADEVTLNGNEITLPAYSYAILK